MRFASGARLGPFEILTPLGAGGMGEVYRARDTRLDRTVAIKLLPSELVSAPGRRVERFRHEARVIARITHPNICTLHDVGEDGSAIFLVMEYVEGATLAQRLEDGPLALPLALRVAVQTADALDHAHRHGVVHRDLKPSNVILTRDSVKLLDFGLAKLKDRDEQVPTDATKSAMTDAGTIVGTVPYMAPEQIEGHEVDARTDIFAFGVVLYEMVCGRRPFAGDSRASLMAAIVAAEPPALSSIQPQAPASLERLIRRCLAKDPDDRWQTARDLAAELRWIAEGGSGATIAASAMTRRPRRAALWGAVAGVMVTAAVFAATVPAMWPRPVVPEFRQVTYRRGAVSAARFTPDGQSFVYSASWEGQPYAAFLGRPESPDVRDLQLGEARILSISRAGDMAMLLGQQGITGAIGERTLARVPMAGGARRELLTGVVDADWIPGSDALAVIRDPGGGRPWTVEFPLGTTVHEARAAWSLRVSPDASRVAFFEGPSFFSGDPVAMITVIDKAGQKSTVSRSWSGLGLAWAPSGAEIWFTATRPSQQSAGPQLQAVTLAGVERTVYSAPDWLVLHDISSNGRVLLSRNSIRVNVACQAPGEATERDLGWQVASFANALSSDGRTLIFVDGLSGRTRAGTATVFRRSTDGSAAVALGETRGGVALSPDGQWVLAPMDENYVLLPAGAGTVVQLPKGEIVRFTGGAWLRDSKRIVFTGGPRDGKAKGYIQDIPDGLPRAITPDGVVLAAKAAVRDDNFVLGRVGSTWSLYSIHGGEVLPAPAVKPGDLPVQWSDDGRSVYVVETRRDAAPPAFDVFHVELTTGARVLWKTLTPRDPVGVEGVYGNNLVLTPDARSYCYSYMRRLGDLFVVDGLK
jgi:eukaryotic-like serine/threonine-protein kinase